jgi:hypothetical protein
LSALDAHVGKDVFRNVLHDSSSGKTRVLVTHALHFLPQVDLIITIVDGRLAERGTYEELMASDGAFSKFVTEFGSKEGKHDKEDGDDNDPDGEKRETKRGGVTGPGMMQTEERNTGAISWAVYKEYLKAGKGPIVVPLLLISLVLIQGSQVMSSYWSATPLCTGFLMVLINKLNRLVYWQEKKWPRPQGFYVCRLVPK